MQHVSNAYQKSMKDLFRNRGYMMVTFGLINQEAQKNATIDDGDFAYFSKESLIFGDSERDVFDYATLEEDWTKVDGSMYFLPRPENGAFLDNGLVSNGLVSDSAFEFTINLNIKPLEIKGLSINFGENYPIDFDVVTRSGERVEFRDNDTGNFRTEEVIPRTDTVTLVVYRMKNEHSRFRIHSFIFGFGLAYKNDNIISSTLDSYVSPIGEDIPQIDFSLTLTNHNKYFNVDNPKSALNFFETGQEMEIAYGYELDDGSIEWLKGNKLQCSYWEANDHSATIKCVDMFRYLDNDYFRGSLGRRSYYDLAIDVLTDAEVENYYVDPYFKELYSVNPIPNTTHRQALQIIANACRGTLTQSRDGVIEIRSNFIPRKTITCNEQAPYSNVENVLEDTPKAEYGSMANNYTVANGDMYNIDHELQGGLETGFVSASISDENGEFETNPILTITQETAFRWHGAKFVFGYALPGEMIVRTFKDGELVIELEIRDFTKETLINEDFWEFDVMEVEFTKTEYPFSRIVLNHFDFADITNFTMQRHDITSDLTSIKNELVKDITVPSYSYSLSTEQRTSILTEELTVASGDEVIFTFADASYDLSVEIEGRSGGVTLLESGTFFVRVRFSVSGDIKFVVNGYKYKLTHRNNTIRINNRGKSIVWENPLVSSVDMALDLANWLGEYFNIDIEYEYDTRGNPEMDTNDIIHQENDFRDDMLVRVYRQSFSFNGAFHSKVSARRITYVA